MLLCVSCGNELENNQTSCSNCGFVSQIRHDVAGGSRIAGAWLAILLGAFGAQWFYFGKPLKAFGFMLIAPIASIIGIVQGIRFLRMSDSEFSTYRNSIN
jgi:hypothetical protein